MPIMFHLIATRLNLLASLMILTLFCFGATSFAWADSDHATSGDALPSNALIMITSPSCPWCDAFEAEVGVIYDKTTEAKVFPLRRIDIFEKFPTQIDHITEARMTPTFIIIRGNQEIGRMVGYPGDELFWWRFSEYTAR